MVSRPGRLELIGDINWFLGTFFLVVVIDIVVEVLVLALLLLLVLLGSRGWNDILVIVVELS